MIAINNERNETTWQTNFAAMLPEIEQKLRLAFCRLDAEAREDAIEEAIIRGGSLRMHPPKSGLLLQLNNRLRRVFWGRRF